MAREPITIPDKLLLSIEEAAAYTGIGTKKLRAMANDHNCSFVIYVGHKIMIKRRLLERYLETQYSI